MSLLTRHTEHAGGSFTEQDRVAVSVSVIVPVAERCDDLAEVYQTHAAVLERTGRSFEFLFVIDGGFEWASGPLDRLIAEGMPIRVITLPRSFGEATALTVGFEQAHGDVLVTVPAYFQVEPKGLEDILQAIEKGHDIVATRRWPRIDSNLNRLQTRLFHFITARLTGVNLHDIGCGLRAIRKRVISEIHLYGDLHRFLPIFAFQRGFRLTEVSVPQHPREARLRVYRPGVYLRRFLDIMTMVFLFKFTKKPLRFFGLIGSGLFASGLTISLLVTMQRIISATPLADRPLLIMGVLLMVLGVQVGSIGLLGEMIIFTHARKMKDYAIENFLR